MGVVEVLNGRYEKTMQMNDYLIYKSLAWWNCFFFFFLYFDYYLSIFLTYGYLRT